jgi:hypothetical protein
MKILPHQLGHFKKLAKQLLGQFKNGKDDARFRVAKFFPESLGLSLDLAQHIIAVEHEFESWETLSSASAMEMRLAIVMKTEPLLNAFGMGVGEIRLRTEDYWTALAKDRVRLRGDLAKVELTAKWLRLHIKRIKTINTRSSSYGLKHVVEREIGYITNGVFIAAAMIEGYPYRTRRNFPNVYFGMSQQSWSPIRAAQEARLNAGCA